MILDSHARSLELAAAWRRGDSVAELRARFGLRGIPAAVSVMRKRGYDVPRRLPKKARAADPQEEARSFAEAWNGGASIDDLRKRFGFASRQATITHAWTLRRRGLDVVKRLRTGALPQPESEPEVLASGPNAWPTPTGTRSDLACLRCELVGWTSTGLENRLCSGCNAINAELGDFYPVMRARTLLERATMTNTALIKRQRSAA